MVSSQFCHKYKTRLKVTENYNSDGKLLACHKYQTWLNVTSLLLCGNKCGSRSFVVQVPGQRNIRQCRIKVFFFCFESDRLFCQQQEYLTFRGLFYQQTQMLYRHNKLPRKINLRLTLQALLVTQGYKVIAIADSADTTNTRVPP